MNVSPNQTLISSFRQWLSIAFSLGHTEPFIGSISNRKDKHW